MAEQNENQAENKDPGGRPPTLDDNKRRQIIAILANGSSRRVAARVVGCTIAPSNEPPTALPESVRTAGQRCRTNHRRRIAARQRPPSSTIAQRRRVQRFCTTELPIGGGTRRWPVAASL